MNPQGPSPPQADPEDYDIWQFAKVSTLICTFVSKSPRITNPGVGISLF